VVECAGLENPYIRSIGLFLLRLKKLLTYQQPTNIMLRMIQNYSPRTRHNPTEVRQIRGYPDSLKLFRMPASKYWYVRMYIRGGPSSGVKKSTRCLHLSDAEDFAINWYEERLLERRNKKFIEEQSFGEFSQRFQTTQERQISRGELVAEMHYNDKLKLDNDLLPYLGHIHVSKIDYNIIDNFIAELHGEKVCLNHP
jgi:hypothetical protein